MGDPDECLINILVGKRKFDHHLSVRYHVSVLLSCFDVATVDSMGKRMGCEIV